MPASDSDVLVVGGGVIGLACAYRLAAEGADVRLIDASGAQGASWAAAGMLAPISEATFGEAALTRLTVAAVPRFTALAAELEAATGSQVGLRRDGTLVVAFNSDDKAALARLSAFRSEAGLSSEPLTGRQARELEPYLATSVRSGVFAADDLSVNNRAYVTTLRAAAEAVGVAFVHEQVGGLLQSSARTHGAVTVTGVTYEAATTVLCAGSATPKLLDVEVYPVKGQILRLAVPERLSAAGPVLTRTVRGLVRGSEVYLVPRAGGEIVLGATSEQQGHDTTVTAGAVYELLRNAYELLPISSEFAFVEARAGLRPSTPDNGPLVGRVDDGLILATGHYRNGILLSAITSDAVHELAAGRGLGPEWAAFEPTRFARG